jgi:SAM-dependent methyltransferase
VQDQPYSGVENLETMAAAKNYNRYLLAEVRKHACNGARVLDFGAGAGQFAVPMSQGFDLTAVELDEELHHHLVGQGVRAVRHLAELPDGAFDYVYSLNVLEHIEDDLAVLTELRKKLKRAGQVVIYVPAWPLLYTSMDRKVGHVRRYTRKTLVARVVAAGFRVERVRYVDSLGYFATLLFKLLGNDGGDINKNALIAYDRLVFPISRLLDRVVGRWLGKNVLLVGGV